MQLNERWSFAYPGFLASFKRACNLVGIRAVPYQARHSGASIDRLKEVRTLGEVQKRGRWMSHKSVARYEKGGRLGEQMNRLPKALQEHLGRCLSGLADFVSGRLPPPQHGGSQRAILGDSLWGPLWGFS